MNPSTALAVVIVDELVRLGVREVVLCPGSRSAPLAYAVHEAAMTGAMRLHVRVDERSAGFLAVGLAKVSRCPAAVVTTSGTAVANLHPAVLEAHHAHVPLVILSADRPAELRGTGANQTTTQPGIFAGVTRWSADVPAAERRGGQQAAWRSAMGRAVASATGRLGSIAGPVHVNLAFREPLVPDLSDEPGTAGSPTPTVPVTSTRTTGSATSTDPTDAGEATAPTAGVDPTARRVPGAWVEPLEGRPAGRPWVEVTPAVPGPWAPGMPIDDVERTLVVIGDLPDAEHAAVALEWASGRGYPVIAEPFVPRPAAVVIPHGPLLLTATDWLERHLPERVVTVGRLTLARPVAALLRRPGLPVEHVTATPSWTDPGHVAAMVHPFGALTAASPVGAPPAPPEVDDGPARGSARVLGPGPDVLGTWAREWVAAGRDVARAIRRRPPPWPSGLAVAAEVVRALPDGATLVVGSSNAVRDLDLAMPLTESMGAGPRVLANRGLAGIDGCVSTAVGVALSPTGGGGCWALMGDLTFVHDSGGLLIGPGEPTPDLTIVVANDDGGGIFSLLEPGDPIRTEPVRQGFERLFGTPTGTDLGLLCRAHGVRHVRPATAEQFRAAVAAAPDGLTVVEVLLERDGHRAAHAALREAAASALGPR